MRRRDAGRKLTTLAMDDATLVAESGSIAAKQWLALHSVSEPSLRPSEIPLPPPPPKGAGATTTSDIEVAGQLADVRRLLSLRITCTSAVDAQKVLGAAAPLGAPSVTIEADLTGDMKDGGKLSFQVADTRVTAAIKPLTLLQTLAGRPKRRGLASWRRSTESIPAYARSDWQVSRYRVATWNLLPINDECSPKLGQFRFMTNERTSR